MAQHIKHWADTYEYGLETKGGMINGTYKYFIITSQFTIQEIFGNKKEHYDAIVRRFKVIRLAFPHHVRNLPPMLGCDDFPMFGPALPDASHWSDRMVRSNSAPVQSN